MANSVILRITGHPFRLAERPSHTFQEPRQPGQQCDAQIFFDLLVAVHQRNAAIRTNIFADGASDNIDNADPNNGHIAKRTQLQLCAADDKKQGKRRNRQLSAFSIRSSDSGHTLHKIPFPSIIHTSKRKS